MLSNRRTSPTTNTRALPVDVFLIAVAVAVIAPSSPAAFADAAATAPVAAAANDDPALQQAIALYDAAVANPFDPAALDPFLNSLPQDGALFIVEGDLPMTKAEVQTYLTEQASGVGSVQARNPELLVNVHNGAKDFYRKRSERILTYTIDRASFPSTSKFKQVAKLMKRATRDWESICRSCGIDFREVSASAGSSPNFVVRHKDTNGAFVARAFFPHHRGTRREVVIDPTFFTTRHDKQGVLRHELGHVLGYRHEHIQNIRGCKPEGGSWVPLTPYDPKSVMHYLCGGGGTLALTISPKDKQGHRDLYDN